MSFAGHLLGFARLTLGPGCPVIGPGCPVMRPGWGKCGGGCRSRRRPGPPRRGGAAPVMRALVRPGVAVRHCQGVSGPGAFVRRVRGLWRWARAPDSAGDVFWQMPRQGRGYSDIAAEVAVFVVYNRQESELSEPGWPIGQ